MSKETAFITGEKAARIAAAFSRRYAGLCDKYNVSSGVAAKLLGVSSARYSSIKAETANGKGPNVSASVLLSLLIGGKRLEQAAEAGILPAKASRGPIQDEIFELLQMDPADWPVDEEPVPDPEAEQDA